MKESESSGQDAESFKTIKGIVQSDIYELWQRMTFVTQWLTETGVTREAIMLTYINQSLNIATENRGPTAAWAMATELRSHLDQLVEKLYATMHGVYLEKLPGDESVKKSDSE